jgi:hypothetical protein
LQKQKYQRQQLTKLKPSVDAFVELWLVLHLLLVAAGPGTDRRGGRGERLGIFF